MLAAKEQLAANRARIDGTSLETHPDVRDAAAAVRSAYLDLSRTVLPAPVAGLVAKRNVQLGERVSPGLPLMSVVPLDQVWVDANFKEPQLAALRIGQPVSLTSDLYGRGVVFHGRVEGLGAGTGSAFALLPAQNATGNWIKIVQRVPVRIALDPRELEAHPLQIGLSMKVDVSVRDQTGARFPAVAAGAAGAAGGAAADAAAGAAGGAARGAGDPPAPIYATNVFDSSDAAAQARVRAIIAANVPAAERSGGDRAQLARAASVRRSVTSVRLRVTERDRSSSGPVATPEVANGL